MTTRVITPEAAARINAAWRELVSATDDGDRVDWWQGIAQAKQGLAEALHAAADAMLRTCETDSPEFELLHVVRYAAHTYGAQAQQAREHAQDDVRRAGQEGGV